MPYAIYKDGARVSHWYPFREQAETVVCKCFGASPATPEEQAHPLTLPGYEIKVSSLKTAEPGEVALARAFEGADISFIHESQDYTGTRGLDFKVADIFFELAPAYSPSAIERCARARNTILVQGKNACSFLIGLIDDRAELARLRAEVAELRNHAARRSA